MLNNIKIVYNMEDKNSQFIQLQALEKEYNVLLNQYEEAYKTYISNLNVQPVNMDESTPKFVNLPGRSFWGQSGLKQGSVSSAKECESMCATDEKCSGATFNSNKEYCWTRTGEGSIAKGLEEDNAIIPVLTENIIVLKTLNTKLIKLNEQINDTFDEIMPTIQEETLEKNNKQKELVNYYSNLLVEKIELDKLYKQYVSETANYQDQTLYVTQQNDKYYMWTILAILLVFSVYKHMFYPDSSSIITNILIILMILWIIYFIYTRYYL